MIDFIFSIYYLRTRNQEYVLFASFVFYLKSDIFVKILAHHN